MLHTCLTLGMKKIPSWPLSMNSWPLIICLGHQAVKKEWEVMFPGKMERGQIEDVHPLYSQKAGDHAGCKFVAFQSFWFSLPGKF